MKLIPLYKFVRELYAKPEHPRMPIITVSDMIERQSDINEKIQRRANLLNAKPKKSDFIKTDENPWVLFKGFTASTDDMIAHEDLIIFFEGDKITAYQQKTPFDIKTFDDLTRFELEINPENL